MPHDQAGTMCRKEPRAVEVKSDDTSKVLVRKKQTVLLWEPADARVMPVKMHACLRRLSRN